MPAGKVSVSGELKTRDEAMIPKNIYDGEKFARTVIG